MFIGLTFAMLVGFVPLEIRPLSAQDHERQPIVKDGLSVDNVTWSRDSQYVVFHVGSSDVDVQMELASWYRYQLDIGVLSVGNVWPLQPQLSDEEKLIFRPADSPFKTYIWLSPNARYIVYVKEDPADTGLFRNLTLGDRVHEVFWTLPIRVQNAFNGPDEFRVVWSADSSAFVTLDRHLLHHVTNYENSLVDARTTLLSNIDFGAWDIYDLSGDGQKLLVSVLTGEFKNRLMVWDITDSSRSILINEVDTADFASAIFAPDTLDRILFVNPEGLNEYDLQSHHTTLLDPAFSGGYFETDEIKFSPDGRWLAYYGFEDGFFVIPMSDYLEE